MMEEMEITPVLFSVFGLDVTAYAVCVCLAVLAGLLVLLFRTGKKLKGDSAFVLAALALPLGLIGARLFYVLVRLPNYPEILQNILHVWKETGTEMDWDLVPGGGYALWGAVGGTVAAALIVAKASRQPLGKLLDALAAPAALMICITRFSENFIGEGHGITIENPLFCRFPFCVNVWDEWHLAVFVFEGIAALVIFMIMLYYSPARDGDGARKFLILYGSCQVLLESLRRDNFLRWFLVRVSQLTAVIVMLFMIIAAIVRWSKAPDKAQTKARVIICTVIFFLCVGGCIGIEFAVDKSDWPYVILYTLLAVCAAGLGITTHQIVFADSVRFKPRHIASGNR